jgi:hypothetical protein
VIPNSYSESPEPDVLTAVAPAQRSYWKSALPYLGTTLIFILMFRLIPIHQVAAALAHVPVLSFVGVFLPFCIFYWLVDSLCLTWVFRRFNAPMQLREIMPIRASMYLLSLVNTNLGQGGVTWYLHRKAEVPFFEVLSSIILIGVMEIYQLFLFSTFGVFFYHPESPELKAIIHVLRIVYACGWVFLAGLLGTAAAIRASSVLRSRIENARIGAVVGTFLQARPLDYFIILAIKSPGFMASLLTQHFALLLYGIPVPFMKLVLFLPLVFLAAALPIGVAHLGTSQAAWVLFFSGNAPEAKILAYSLAAHFTFMFCNALIGLLFLPKASRELTAAQAPAV